MTDREIAIAALHWHACRDRRLELGAEVRREEEFYGGRYFRTALTQQREDAKRKETAALRALAKLCKAQKHVFIIEMKKTPKTVKELVNV